jgi:hypothetical protein
MNQSTTDRFHRACTERPSGVFCRSLKGFFVILGVGLFAASSGLLSAALAKATD